MTLHSRYIEVIEKRMEWLRYAKNPRSLVNQYPMSLMVPLYADVLERGDTYTMNPYFQQLVEHARRCAPDDLTFDHRWMLSKIGWLYLDQPVELPRVESTLPGHQNEFAGDVKYRSLRAIGWREAPIGSRLADNARTHGSEITKTIDRPGTYQILIYQDSPAQPGSFTCWSHFLLHDDTLLGEKVAEFEHDNKAGGDESNYVTDPTDQVLHPLHELRFVYTALHLMAQRLAVTQRHEPDRATRRRVESKGQIAPPFLTVVTLRRLEQDRPRNQSPQEAVDWQWQWSVIGHWRWQYFPSENAHKRIFIESFVKGPPDKPMKPGQIKLFSARR